MLGVGHDVHVDRAGSVDDFASGTATEKRADPAAQSDHQLRGVHRTGELQQGLGYIIAQNHPPLSAK